MGSRNGVGSLFRVRRNPTAAGRASRRRETTLTESSGSALRRGFVGGDDAVALGVPPELDDARRGPLAVERDRVQLDARIHQDSAPIPLTEAGRREHVPPVDDGHLRQRGEPRRGRRRRSEGSQSEYDRVLRGPDQRSPSTTRVRPRQRYHRRSGGESHDGRSRRRTQEYRRRQLVTGVVPQPS